MTMSSGFRKQAGYSWIPWEGLIRRMKRVVKVFVDDESDAAAA